MLRLRKQIHSTMKMKLCESISIAISDKQKKSKYEMLKISYFKSCLVNSERKHIILDSY